LEIKYKSTLELLVFLNENHEISIKDGKHVKVESSGFPSNFIKNIIYYEG